VSLLEHTVEDRVVLYAETLNYLQMKLNALGSKGKPDRLFISPKGTHIYIEFKRVGEPLRALQRYWAKQFYARKCVVYRSESYEHSERILQTHLDPSALPIEGSVTYDEARKRWTLLGSRSRENFYLFNGVQDT
jgi:hypothetical protein